MMKKLLYFSVMICVILISCSERRNIPTVLPSVAAEPSSTAIIGPIKTQTTTLPSTQAITPMPAYQAKEAIFNYYVKGGSNTVFDAFFDPSNLHSFSKLVLYADGQLIIPEETNHTYQQKMLSPEEVKQFLSKFEALGFYSIESNQMHDPTDNLYDYGSNYKKVDDGLSDCISINANKSRELCIYEPDAHYLIPQMKNILQFLNEYEQVGMTPYHPDRILLWALKLPDLGANNPSATPSWPDDLPSLVTSPPSITYVEGDAAKAVYLLLDNGNAGIAFAQDGTDYAVNMHIVLPHERVKAEHQ